MLQRWGRGALGARNLKVAVFFVKNIGAGVSASKRCSCEKSGFLQDLTFTSYAVAYFNRLLLSLSNPLLAACPSAA